MRKSLFMVTNFILFVAISFSFAQENQALKTENQALKIENQAMKTRISELEKTLNKKFQETSGESILDRLGKLEKESQKLGNKTRVQCRSSEHFKQWRD